MFPHFLFCGCGQAVGRKCPGLGKLSKLSVTMRPVSGLMTMMTRYVRKVLLGAAIRLQTQQPTDQKKEGDQEHAEGNHRRYAQMDRTEEFRICSS